MGEPDQPSFSTNPRTAIRSVNAQSFVGRGTVGPTPIDGSAHRAHLHPVDSPESDLRRPPLPESNRPFSIAALNTRFRIPAEAPTRCTCGLSKTRESSWPRLRATAIDRARFEARRFVPARRGRCRLSDAPRPDRRSHWTRSDRPSDQPQRTNRGRKLEAIASGQTCPAVSRENRADAEAFQDSVGFSADRLIELQQRVSHQGQVRTKARYERVRFSWTAAPSPGALPASPRPD